MTLALWYPRLMPFLVLLTERWRIPRNGDDSHQTNRRRLPFARRPPLSLIVMFFSMPVWATGSVDWTTVMAQADRYMYGQGVAQDRGKAAVQYEKACAAGVKDACAELTEILYWGNPAVPKDTKRAVKLMKSLFPYLKQACQRNEPRACLRLGAAFADGIGTKRDLGKAAALDFKACHGGFVEGCYYLGVAYAKGRGVEIAPAKAAGMYQKACDGGYAAGCARLSALHAKGNGVPKSTELAQALRNRACTLGHLVSCSDD